MKKEQLISFIKKHQLIIKAAVMALLPLLCCMVTCAAQGYTLNQVYLPASEWNDEMIYYKQVEGILQYGYPYGYYGFNETHALKLSFAAWSPVLLIPWVLWGLVFGWNFLAPVYCNIFLMMLALFLFVVLARPTGKQMGILAFLFCLFTPFTRYMLSGMPEIICISQLILFYGLSVNYLKREKVWKLVLLFAFSGSLTLMRPYLFLFMLLPAWLWIRRMKVDPGMKSDPGMKKISIPWKIWLGVAGSAAVLGVTVALYVLIKRYLAAEYFTPLFDTTWAGKFLHEGIFAGIKYIIYRLWDVGKTFLAMTVEGFRSGLAAGARFAGYLLIMLLLLWQTWQDYRKKRNNELLLNGHMAFCFLGMLAALLLMYKMEEGSKHLLTFMAVGIFAVSRMETRFYRKAVLLGVVCAYLYSFKAVSAIDYQIPFATEEKRLEIEAWQQAFADEMILNTQQKPSFDNVVIWVFNDEMRSGSRLMDFEILYALPAGMGISCCKGDYVAENLTGLQSKYIAAPAGGRVDSLCLEAEYSQVGRIGESVVYRLR